MTVAAVASSAVPTWQEVLPRGRDYVALPSVRRPRVVAEHDRGVLAYVRSALLAAPPGGAAPPWLYDMARGALTVPPVWRAVPHLPCVPHQDGSTVAPGDDRLRDRLAALDRRVAVLQHSNDGDGRFTVLLFPRGGSTPDVVVKVAGRSSVRGRLDVEATRLRDLADVRLGDLGATVPRVLGPPVTHLPSTLAVTAVPGVPILVRYHRGGRWGRPDAVRADFAAAAAWLHRFAGATAVHPATGDPTTTLDPPAALLGAVVERLDLVPGVEDELLDAVLTLRGALRRHHVPRSWVHGDFWPGNVLTDAAGTVTGVVDWEAADPAGNPVRDLARFVLGHCAYLDRHTRVGGAVRGHPGLRADHGLAGLRYALDGAGWYPTLVRRFLTDGLGLLGVTADAARPAVLAEVLAVAAEATDEDFCRTHLRAFLALSRGAA